MDVNKAKIQYDGSLDKLKLRIVGKGDIQNKELVGDNWSPTSSHRWELTGNYPVFTVVMVIYHYVDRIWRILVAPIFNITYTIVNMYYLDEPINIYIQSLKNIIQENNWVITTKKG